MNLDKYYIGYVDHTDNEIATEGFFRDDKNAKATEINEANGGVKVIKYKNVTLAAIPGPNWADMMLSEYSNTTEPFKKNGIAALKSCLQELHAADQFVKANGDKYRQAVANKDNEVCTELANGLRDCFAKLVARNRAWNAGNREFSGSLTPLDDRLKAQLKPILNDFQKLFDSVATNLAKKSVDEHFSKSTLKKVFRHTEKAHFANNYLETELYLYCKDVWSMIGEGFYR